MTASIGASTDFHANPATLRAGPRGLHPISRALIGSSGSRRSNPPEANPWVETLCELILRGDPAVLGLFSRNPFPGRPPSYVRVVRYRYEFTDAAERART